MLEISIGLLKITSVIFSGLGAYFWIRRNVWNSPSWIADLAQSKFDYNETTVKELCGQRADSLVAWIYVFLATLTQTTLFFTPSSWNSLGAFNVYYVVYLIIFGFILFLVGNFVSRRQEKILVSKVKFLLDSALKN